MTYPRTVTAQLLGVDGSVVGAADLSNAFAVEWYDEWNGPGHGSLTFPLSDSNVNHLTPGRYVNCLVEGTARFTFKIEGNPTFKLIDQGEEYEQVLIVKGRGWAVALDEAQTWPEPALNSRLDTSWRLFSFASPSFPNAGSWTPAVELYEYLDGVTTGLRRQLLDGNLYPSPVNYAWPISPNNYDSASPPGASYSPTYWIWSEAGYPNEEYQLGWCFFRNTFTIASDTVVTFAPTGDNFFTFFVEGVPILGEDADTWMWQGWKEVSVPMSAGTYTVAAFVENVGFPGQTGALTTNPGGFIATIHRLDGNQVPVEAYLVTDSSWDCFFVGNEDKWPGWTPGQIVDKLVDEGVARGALMVLNSITFSAFLDSNGDAWLPLDPTVNYEYAASFAVEVGTTLLDALGQLNQEGWINWHVQPGTFNLDVFRGREPAPSSSATLAAGVNLLSLERAETAKYANALLVQWEQGYVEVEDAAAIASYGTRVEDIFSADSTSANDAEQAGRTELIKRAQEGWPAIVAEVEPVDATDCPYEAYTVGDWVTVPAVGGGTEVVRVLAIRCQQDEEGYAQWTLELNRKMRVAEREQQDLLRQIGGRSGVTRGSVT